MSFSEFTKEDKALIRKDYLTLMDVARSRCRNTEEVKMVEKAFKFANQAHTNIRRRSGEPYMLHPIAVAQIVVSEIGLGYKSICAALLHDVVEDTDYTIDDIRNLFGEKISTLVDGLTKIKTVLDNEDKKGTHISTESLQAENFKRILLTLNDDVRVVLIKLADRLHNCRTIEFMPEHKRDKILSETMFIFIPLAHRLGLYEIKTQLENIWLKYKEPEDYKELNARIESNISRRDKDIDNFIAPIEKALANAGYSFVIKKRIKTPYSIWHKMHTKHVPFEQIFDLYAVRIIFDNIDENRETERNSAYNIFSIVSNVYKLKENISRHRDWISQPKSNGYEAIHCTLMSDAGIWIEVQIRSRRMDDIAEKGIAAHWAYKRRGFSEENDSEMDKWLAQIQDILLSEDVSDLELLDIIHRDLVSSELVVFTPKGEQKTIVGGATALDFAYLIHTKIGARAIAAKVNMKLVPLSYILKAGDQVEIITAANAVPKIEWLQFLRTRYAKNRVIDYFKSDRTRIAAQGKKIFDERLRVLGIGDKEGLCNFFLERCQINDTNELYFRIGLGTLGPEQFKVIVDEKESGGAKAQSNIKYRIADCCHPIPGDSLIGFHIGPDTIEVHKKSCPVAESIASKFGNRVMVPQWTAMEQEFPVKISLKGIDRMGLLSDISNFISKDFSVNMRNIQLSTDSGVFEGDIELLVKDKSKLIQMMEGLKEIDGISDVVRTDI